MIVIESVCCAVRDPLSVTPIVKFDVPAVVGVPVIAPDEGFNDRPAGNVPVSVHVYGVVPPVATTFAEYG
jgi:hypothetical protein